MTFDYQKANRQLWAAFQGSTVNARQELSHLMLKVYFALSENDKADAERYLNLFDKAVGKLGWQGGSSTLPRPFNHQHLERLYWDARKAVRGETRPPPARRKREDDYENIHLQSRIAKKPVVGFGHASAKPRFLGRR